jgi:hypothetical protein
VTFIIGRGAPGHAILAQSPPLFACDRQWLWEVQLSAQRIVAHQDRVGPFRMLFAPLSANRLLSCCAVVHNRTAVPMTPMSQSPPWLFLASLFQSKNLTARVHTTGQSSRKISSLSAFSHQYCTFHCHSRTSSCTPMRLKVQNDHQGRELIVATRTEKIVLRQFQYRSPSKPG